MENKKIIENKLVFIMEAMDEKGETPLQFKLDLMGDLVAEEKRLKSFLKRHRTHIVEYNFNRCSRILSNVLIKFIGPLGKHSELYNEVESDTIYEFDFNNFARAKEIIARNRVTWMVIESFLRVYCIAKLKDFDNLYIGYLSKVEKLESLELILAPKFFKFFDFEAYILSLDKYLYEPKMGLFFKRK